MSYTPLKNCSNASDDDQTWPSGHARRFSGHVQLTISFYTAICVTIIGFLFLFQLKGKVDLYDWKQDDSTGTFKSTFSRDRRFMTLNHKYDYLWEEWGEDTQVMIYDQQTDSQLPGAISMCVLLCE